MFWKARVLATIRAFDLIPFISKISPPAKYTSNLNIEGEDADSQIVNPDYLLWIRSDKLLLGWLFSTMSQDFLAQVIQCESSEEVWSTLETLYSQQTVAKSF